MSKLTGRLAHEIKNPLSTIKINIKLIAEDADTTESKTSRWLSKVAVVQKETDRLEQILDNFLRYIDKAKPLLRETDINELITETADFFRPQVQTNSITIRLGLAEKPISCNIDRDMIK